MALHPGLHFTLSSTISSFPRSWPRQPWTVRIAVSCSLIPVPMVLAIGAAIAVLLPTFRRRGMISCDGVGASHGLIKELRPGWPDARRLHYSRNGGALPSTCLSRRARDSGGGQGSGQELRLGGRSGCWARDMCGTVRAVPAVGERARLRDFDVAVITVPAPLREGQPDLASSASTKTRR